MRNSNPLQFDSSLFGRTNCIGFLIDCVVQLMSSLSGYAIILLSGSSYLGIYIYVNAMVRDMKRELMPIENGSSVDLRLRENWKIFKRAINFHIEIIG